MYDGEAPIRDVPSGAADVESTDERSGGPDECTAEPAKGETRKASDTGLCRDAADAPDEPQ